MGPQGFPLGPLGVPLESLGVSLGPLGFPLGPLGVPLGPLGGPFGAPGSPPEAHGRPLGSFVGLSPKNPFHRIVGTQKSKKMQKIAKLLNRVASGTIPEGPGRPRGAKKP